MYELICASTQGSDHIKNGMSCEDYGLIYETEICKIFAVADGHGDSNCPRSQFGSRTACEIAISEMHMFCSDIIENEWESRILANGEDLDSLAKQLITSIVAKWIKTVNENLVEFPLTEEERAGCDKYIDRYDKGERIEHIFGTTLIAGLLTDKYLLLIQQGDGRCVVFNADGSAVQPIPWDDKCFANVTTSLCDEDAIQRTRYISINIKENPIIACFAGSDGVEDSFSSMELMHSYYRDLLVYASENGVLGLNDYLEEVLPDFSKQGSGDDVTICGVIDKERIVDFIPVFLRDNKIVRLESRIREIDDRLKSINGMGKLDALKKRHEETIQSLFEAQSIQEKADNDLKTFQDDLQQLKHAEAEDTEKFRIWNRLIESIFPGNRDKALDHRLLDLQKQVEEAKSSVQEAEEAAGIAEKEYKEFSAKKEAYENEKTELEKQLVDLQNS